MDVARLHEIDPRLLPQEDREAVRGAIVESTLAVTGADGRGFVDVVESGE